MTTNIRWSADAVQQPVARRSPDRIGDEKICRKNMQATFRGISRRRSRLAQLVAEPRQGFNRRPRDSTNATRQGRREKLKLWLIEKAAVSLLGNPVTLTNTVLAATNL